MPNPVPPPETLSTPAPAVPQAMPQSIGTITSIPKIEDDPNHAMAKLIANRGKKPDEKSDPQQDKEVEAVKPDTQKEGEKGTEGGVKVVDLIGKALKFKTKSTKDGPTKDAKGDDSTDGGDADADKPDTTEKKKAAASTKRKSQPEPAIDHAKLAAEAASNTVRDTVREILKVTPKAEPTEKAPKDKLNNEDRYDYDVADHLAKLDPRFKDAPKLILEHVEKSEAYATRWQAANPGKAFDPNDDEHNEFYETLERPWTDQDFRKAEIDMAAEAKMAKVLDVQGEKFQRVEADTARMELAPVVDRKHLEATGALVDLMDDKLKSAAKKGGYEGIFAEDPVAAEVISAAADGLQPFIEAAVQIDDPKQRIRLDPENPVHQQWNTVVVEGEARCAGLIRDGKTFAKRADYAKMTPSQRSRHWFLTTDDIIGGVVDFAASETKRLISEQTGRLKSMGFVRQPVEKSGTVSTPHRQDTASNKEKQASDKPASPTAGSGAKIDDTSKPSKSGNGKLTDALAGILFRSTS